MFKVSLIIVLLRYIPETLLVIWGINLFSLKKINLKLYLLSCLVYLLSTFLLRMLHIDYGVYISLVIIICIFTAHFINKISVINSISSSLISIILLSICELFNIIILEMFFKINIQNTLYSPLKESMYGLPSLVLLLIIILISYYLPIERKKMQESISKK